MEQAVKGVGADAEHANDAHEGDDGQLEIVAQSLEHQRDLWPVARFSLL